MNKTIGLLLCVSGILAGCSTHKPQVSGTKVVSEVTSVVTPVYERPDGPPSYPVNVDAIPDAVPRIEAKSPNGNPEVYTVFGQDYRVMPDNRGYVATGIASWYGSKFHGRKTSNGETYDMLAMTAAHRSLPIPTYLRVTNLDNGQTVIVRVNDRGPFHEDRIIDLSYAAASKLGINATGTARVKLTALDPRAEAENNEIRYSASNTVYLQLGAFSEYQNAVKLKHKLKQLPNPKIQTEHRSHALLYRVQIGPIASAWHARKIKQQLAKLGITHYRSITAQTGS